MAFTKLIKAGAIAAAGWALAQLTLKSSSQLYWFSNGCLLLQRRKYLKLQQRP